jgi:hypothetical protein
MSGLIAAFIFSFIATLLIVRHKHLPENQKMLFCGLNRSLDLSTNTSADQDLLNAGASMLIIRQRGR